MDLSVRVANAQAAHGTMTDIAWGTNDPVTAAEHAAATHRLAEKNGNPYLMVYGRAFQGLGQAVCGDFSQAATTLGDALRFARQRRAGMENEARMLGDLAWVQLRAGLADRARATAEEAAAVARQRGAKVWQAYAEWLLSGPSTPAFRELLAETGADLLSGLKSPRTS